MTINRSQNKVTYDKVAENGSQLATVIDVVMDKDFIEKSRHDWCWVGWGEVPTETGWYRVDRQNEQLLKITTDQAGTLEWHERLFVYGSGHAAVTEHNPLALYIGDEYSDGRLSALYLCGPDVLTWAAIK